MRREVLAAARAVLLDEGYEALSLHGIARRAGVHPTTVYRRWGSRARLTADTLLEYAAELVPVPDCGSLRTDLETFLDEVLGLLADERFSRLARALAAVADADPDMLATRREFWDQRIAGAATMVHRAIARGELEAGTDAEALIEQLIAPLYLRVLVTGRPLDRPFAEQTVTRALRAFGARPEP